MDRLPDLYTVLGLGPQATPAEISRAYRTLARRYHPDTSATQTTAKSAARERALLQDITAAHAVLADPHKKILYDRRHPTPPAPRQSANLTTPAPSPLSVPIAQRGSGASLSISALRWEPTLRRRI